MTIQLKQKPEHISDTYNFKEVIKHVDIVQAEIEFIEKYGHLLDDNNLITRTLVDYETKSITVEGSTNKHFSPTTKDPNKGFIFDFEVNTFTSFVKVFGSIGLTSNDFTFYIKEGKAVTTSNKLTKQIIDDAKKVIELESRLEVFTKIYYFDKRPTVQDLLQSQLNFIAINNLHEDDITCVVIDTNEEKSYEYFNTIRIIGKQSNKHKTYSDDVTATINSCVIVDRFDSLLESALKDGGSDNVIQRVISYQHPIVGDNTLELLEGPVDVNSSLQDVVQSIPIEPGFPTEYYNAMLDTRINEGFKSIFTKVEGEEEELSQEPQVEGNFPTNFSIADFATETLPKPKPQYPVVETGDKVYKEPLQTSFELNEITFGQPDKVNHESIHPRDLAKFKDCLYIKLSNDTTINDKLIEVLELQDEQFYYKNDKSAIVITSKHVTADFIKDKIKQLGGHSKLAPQKEIRVFTYSNDKDIDVSDLIQVKAFFDDLIQRYSDEHDVTIKPIKLEVELNYNSASATVEITHNYLRLAKTKEEAAVIIILYNALLLKQIIDNKA